MKNFPRKLDSKTTSLRITVPENLDLALEGLIRKVLKEQPKTDDIYSFAADYFETLLKIRDKAGAKYMSSQICSFHNDEDAHEMIKLANSFPKPKTASDERKLGQDSGKSLPSGKSPAIKESEKVITGSRIMGDKRKRPDERIISTTKAKNKTIPSLVKSVAEEVTKPSPSDPKVKDEKEDKLLIGSESNLQDIDEDEEFLKSDPIKELVERELMSKTAQNDINRDEGQSSTDMAGKEKLETEKAVDKVSKVIEPQENGELKDEFESKENRKNEALEEETTTTGDELCAVVDALSIQRALKKENETTTNEKEENKEEVGLNKSEKEKTEEGGQAVEAPKPETEEAVKLTDESTPEKPKQVTENKIKDLKEEKPEDDIIIKQEEDNEKKETQDDGDKPKEPTGIVDEAKEGIKEIKDKLEDTTEDVRDKSKEDSEDNTDKPKEVAEDVKEKPKDTDDIKGVSVEKEETDTTNNKNEEDITSEKSKDDIKTKSKEDAEDNKDKPKDTEDIKVTSAEKEETDITTNKNEEETPSEKPKVEVTETEDTTKTTEETEKETSNISEENSISVPNGSKEESANDQKEGKNQKEETTNQTSVPEENSSQEETTKEEISNGKPLTDSKDPIEKQEDEEIRSQIATDELLKTTEAYNTQTTENKLEKDDESKVTKEKVEEELPKTEEISTTLTEGNKTTETDVEKQKAENKTHPSDQEDIKQNEKPEDEGENHLKDVVVDNESSKETKEDVIEKEETKLQSESMVKKEVEEEPAKSKPEEETDNISTEDEKKPDGTEKPISETDLQEDKPEKPKIIVSTEKETGEDIIEDESKPEIKVEEAKPTEKKPEPIDQEQLEKVEVEDKPEGVKLETEQLTRQTETEPETDQAKVIETGPELKEDNNEEIEKSEKPETTEEPEKEFPSGSELKGDEETLDEKATPEVKVEATEGKFEPGEVKEHEKLSAQVDTKVDEEAIAVAAPEKDDKDSVEDERQKTPNAKNEEPLEQTKTEEPKQTEETENLKNEENNLSTENIPPRQDSKEAKELETTSNKVENEIKETVEENKPEDANKDLVPSEETTETAETITEATAEEELCTVVDTQNLTEPNKTNQEAVKPEDGRTIKTITTHYYDLLQVPTTVTKEFKVHRTGDDSLTQHNLSNVGNTIIKSYQLVKELTSDGDNNNNPQTVSQDISPDIGSTNKTQETEIESDIPKDEIEDLNATPTFGNLSELNLFTMHDLFLDSERKLSSYQKEETKFSSLKNAKQSLEDTKIQTESPKTPPTNDDDKQEVEEIITKTVIPRIPEAVPDPPRDLEEINKETNAEETNVNIKDKKEDDKADTNSSDDSTEPTDSSNNGRSIDSDVPIISVEVRTVIETQILDDDEEVTEDTQKGSDYRTELTLTDGSNDVNVEVEATIQVPIETTDSENGDNQNLTDQEKSRELQKAKQQTDKQEPPPEETPIKSSNEDSEAGGSSTTRDGSSGESDSTTLTAATEIKRFDSSRKNFARSSTQDLLTTQSLDSCKRPPLLKTRSLSVFRQGVTDFEIWNTIEKELEEAATKIQSKYRGYTVRKRLRREDAVQITTEESSISTTPVEQEPNLDEDNFRTTGEFHDSIVLSIHPR